MQHTIHDCSTAWCSMCRNKHRLCTTCKGLDKELATECPGAEMTRIERDAVYSGALDFRDGEWVDGLV